MCEYPIIAPPFSLNFRKMSKKEVNDYYRWYLNQIPERIAILERTVNCTLGFEDWKADCRPESLDKLGEWFAMQVETRERTKADIDRMNEGVPDRIKSIPLPEWELTNRTYSIAIDVGMYLSQVMLKHIPKLKWQSTANIGRTWMEFGHPILTGLNWPNWHVFNPTRMMISYAYSIVKGEWKSSELRETFEYWKQPPKEYPQKPKSR